MKPSGPRVAVLGAGLTGSLVALELAQAGLEVSLFDRLEQPLLAASLACEGKIHQGYVYALDSSGRTLTTMQRGAAVFERLVEPWVGSGTLRQAESTPFLYAVPRDSVLPADAIRRHFDAVARAASRFGCSTFPTADGAPWQELPPAEFAATFDRRHVTAAFQTREYAIDAAVLASGLRRTLAEKSGLRQRMGCAITGLAGDRKGFVVKGIFADEPFSERYDVVVNALWENRLRIDASLGLAVGRRVVHRFKFGISTDHPEARSRVPSVTFISGAFGDAVAFPESIYLSWYPTGLVSQEVTISPSRRVVSETADLRDRIVADTISNLHRLMPSAAALLALEPSEWTLRGGFITAWGHSGIDDARSELHERYDVGVFSEGNYHSIDTGKWTLAPLFAHETCNRILGRREAAG